MSEQISSGRPHPALTAALLCSTLWMAGCGDGDGTVPLHPDTVASPAAAGSGEPDLAVGPDGVVYLSWLEPTDGGHALKLAPWDDGGWGQTRTVIRRPNLFVNWADFPSIAVLDGGILAAHWLERSGPGPYAYDVRVALSRDGGATWGDDIVLHRDGVEAEHGFVSLVPYHQELAALWLDGRATVHGDPMTLRFTTVDADGRLGNELRVDGSVCDCCQTAMAATTDGLVAAYRNRTDGEVRDIYVARYADGEWSDGRPVHDDGWVIPGCPVNGPAVAARGDTVAVAWFTAAEESGDAARTREEIRAAGERGRVLAAFSTDQGGTFGAPVRVDDGEAMGRVDIALLDGAAVVSWLERTGDGAEVRVRRVDAAGIGPASVVAGAKAERATGFPRMVRAGDRLVFAWTMPGETGGVRTAVVELPTEWKRSGGGER